MRPSIPHRTTATATPKVAARLVVALLAAGVLGLSVFTAPVLAGGGGHAACTPRAEGSTIALHDSCLDPVTLTTDDGELVIRNEGFIAHDYVAVDGAFDTGLLDPGEEITLPVPSPGVYDAYCTLHGTAAGQGMAGTLVVAEADATGGSTSDGIPTGGTAREGAPIPDGAPIEAAVATPSRSAGTHPATWGALGVATLALAVAGAALRRSGPVGGAVSGGDG